MSERISEDDWRAEIDRVQADSKARDVHRKWTDEERAIVSYARGKVRTKQLLVILNKENEKADRSPRTLIALESFIKRMLDED